ncbi:hypothetical protein BJV82DRAFT_614054 [Fennellomyces sp. T-0311]|nr:hypothetical protein BJV82DRAFT_614054 [Fennellomyces sp. T-0311]
MANLKLLVIFAVATLLTTANADSFRCACYNADGSIDGGISRTCCGQAGGSFGSDNICSLDVTLVDLKNAATCCQNSGRIGNCPEGA